ncbi:MAG: hypothetical protein AABX31_01430, partial [Nanoarchaeota archaeon]
MDSESSILGTKKREKKKIKGSKIRRFAWFRVFITEKVNYSKFSEVIMSALATWKLRGMNT